MAAIFLRYTAGGSATGVGLACGVSAAKTLGQVIAASNQRVRLNNWAISTDGVTNTASPVQFRILRQTTTGTQSGTATVPPQLVLVEKELTETIQTTYIFNVCTSEPTPGDVYRSLSVPAFMGNSEVFLPYGQEFVVQGGGKLGFESNAGAAVNAHVEAGLEE